MCIEEMMHLTFRIVGRTLFSTDVRADADEIGKAMAFALVYANEYVESIAAASRRGCRRRRTCASSAPEDARSSSSIGIIEDRRKSARRAERFCWTCSWRSRTPTRQREDERPAASRRTDDAGVRRPRDDGQRADLALVSALEASRRREEARGRGRPGPRRPSSVARGLAEARVHRRVIKEALRLYPPAWVFERHAMADDVVGGYRIPAGSTVGISPVGHSPRRRTTGTIPRDSIPIDLPRTRQRARIWRISRSVRDRVSASAMRSP